MSNAEPTTFGAYALLHMIGRGGSGTAYLAVPLDVLAGIPSPVVLKILNTDAARDELDRARFEHEAKLAVTTNSPALATVYDVGLVGETPYIAMELVRGMSMSRLLAALRDRGAVLPLADVVAIAQSALSGLKELHDARDERGRELGAIHRDLSPNNLMLEPGLRVRILDLGMGRSRLRAAKTQTGVIIGTPGYMSPEQVLAAPVSQRSDVYTIGTIFWELLAGRRYIARGELTNMLVETVKRRFEPPSAYRSGLSPRFDEVCKRALEIEAQDRFASAAEFLRELDSLREATVANRATPVPAAMPVVPLSTVYQPDLGDYVLALAGSYTRPDDDFSSQETAISGTFVLARRTLDTFVGPTKIAPTKIVRRKTPVLAFVGVFAIVAAVLSTLLILKSTQPIVEALPPPVPEREAPAAAAPAPSVQAREREHEVENRPVVEEESAPSIARTPPPRKRQESKLPAETQAAAPPSLEELITRLNQLARSAKRARPELASSVDELINAGLFEAAAGDTPAVRARLRQITSELEALRESGEKREARPDR